MLARVRVLLKRAVATPSARSPPPLGQMPLSVEKVSTQPQSTLAETLMDSSLSGAMLRTMVIFVGALCGAQVVHAVMQPDLVRQKCLICAFWRVCWYLLVCCFSQFFTGFLFFVTPDHTQYGGRGVCAQTRAPGRRGEAESRGGRFVGASIR